MPAGFELGSSAYVIALPRLPDGIFSYQNWHFLYTFEGRGMENIGDIGVSCSFGIFIDNLVYFIFVGYFCDHFGIYFFLFLVCCTKTNLATLCVTPSSTHQLFSNQWILFGHTDWLRHRARDTCMYIYVTFQTFQSILNGGISSDHLRSS
jgi:hypothetical protein